MMMVQTLSSLENLCRPPRVCPTVRRTNPNFPLLRLSLLLAVTSATQYECRPYPEKRVCIVDFLSYLGDGKPITFPTGYDHYQIRLNSENQVMSHVTIFDEALYEAMHRPKRIEMAAVSMEKLILLPELHMGNFARNRLSSVTAEVGRNYQISYLDLAGNNLQEITFLSPLVNLEVLHLENNHISTIPGSAVTPLTKLKYLYLQHNGFSSIPWIDLPRSLILLDCSYGLLESAEFANVSLPSLKYLNLEHNDLTTINITALLLVAPHLKETLLHNRRMTEDETDQMKATLRSNNISFVDFPDPKKYCFIGDNLVELKDGQCVPNQVGTPLIIFISVVVILIVATFIYAVVHTLNRMNGPQFNY